MKLATIMSMSPLLSMNYMFHLGCALVLVLTLFKSFKGDEKINADPQTLEMYRECHKEFSGNRSWLIGMHTICAALLLVNASNVPNTFKMVTT